MIVLKYFILAIIEVLLVIKSWNIDLSAISNWLIGINFTLAVFSVNFTFFGYQLSRYKPIHDKLTKRQWFNIVIVFSLPFIPILAFLFFPTYYEIASLWMMPIILFSSIDNARLTSQYLNPEFFLHEHFSKPLISKYVRSLYSVVAIEVKSHKEYLRNIKKFQIPSHKWEFYPNTLGITKDDLWDKIVLVLKKSLENNDYAIFMKSLTTLFDLLRQTYSFPSQTDDDFLELQALMTIAHSRLQSIIRWIYSTDAEGTFVNAISNQLCIYLTSEEAVSAPAGTLTKNIAKDAVWIGSKMLESEEIQEPMKILNAFHSLVELAIHQIKQDINGGKERFFDQHNIALYVYLIKSLGVAAVKNERTHFVYRTMETLSYLGCNATKIKARQTVLACFESLVQIGRSSRKAKLGCFWNRCIIPMHLHAEEFMGHILTWLIRDIDKDGNFFLKGVAERAYSRLRGFECKIIPKHDLNPKFWIEEVIDDKTDKPIDYIESLSDMYGYNGTLNYSNFEDLTEYVLHDF